MSREGLRAANLAVHKSASRAASSAAHLPEASWLWGGLRGLQAASTPRCRQYYPADGTSCGNGVWQPTRRLDSRALLPHAAAHQQRHHSAMLQRTDDDQGTHGLPEPESDSSRHQQARSGRQPSSSQSLPLRQEHHSQGGRWAPQRRTLPSAEEVRRVLKGELAFGDGGSSVAVEKQPAQPPQPALDWRGVVAAVRAGQGEATGSRAVLTDSFA